jgi:imidazolonepropionase-like amidohydrolase
VDGVGKRADLLIIDGNPLDDITLLNTRSAIRMVVKHGAIVTHQLSERTPADR